MILADTSIWVEHRRRGSDLLSELLEAERISSHPFVIGELVFGGTEKSLADALLDLPQVIVATDEEVRDFIGRHEIVGRRIGYVDVHLLASARLTSGTQVWTFDKSLRSVAQSLGLFANLAH